MADGLLIFLAVLNAYILALFLLHRRGKLQGPTLEALGPLLLVRTERGKRLIDRISKLRTFWKAYGDVGVGVSIVAAVLTLGLLVFQLFLLFTRTDLVRQAAPSPEYYLVLPGINPLIPLWYGLLGLVVALVVHEGAHGVLARAHDLKVKSLGLLWFIVPIGAFVEPDDEELERAPTRVKNRVFAAGVMTNLVVALVAAMVFSAAWASTQPAAEGLVVGSVIPETGAEAAGVQAGWVLTHVEGRPVRTLQEFNASLATRSAGETLQMTFWRDGASFGREVQLIDKYAFYERTNPNLNEEAFRGKGFVGVSTFPMATLQLLRDINVNPLGFGWGGFTLFISEPFPVLGGLGAVSPFPQPFEHVFAVQGAFGALPAPVFWVLVNAAYWVFWLNLMVGMFNALPMVVPLPLDGGQMFKASLKGLLRRAAGVPREKIVVEKPLASRAVLVRGSDAASQAQVERIEGLVQRASLVTGLVILALILLPILGPRLI